MKEPWTLSMRALDNCMLTRRELKNGVSEGSYRMDDENFENIFSEDEMDRLLRDVTENSNLEKPHICDVTFDYSYDIKGDKTMNADMTVVFYDLCYNVNEYSKTYHLEMDKDVLDSLMTRIGIRDQTKVVEAEEYEELHEGER